MSEITVTLNGKSFVTSDADVSSLIKDRRVIAARLNGNLVDLSTVIADGDVIEGVRMDTPDGLDVLRHSTAHLMAEAVKSVFPEANPTIGPATSDGFYYDFDVDQAFSSEDLERIEAKMHELVTADKPFVRKEMASDEAVEFFRAAGEPYKVEIIEDLAVPSVSLYEQGGFVDLCRGPHVPSTGCLKVFKLLSVAGAYWRGSENNKMLQRIYGTAFATPKELKAHLNFLEEVKKRDHRRLGREMNLFLQSDEAGPGLVIYQPKGGMVRYLLEEFDRKIHLKRGYEIVYGPNMLRDKAWEISGHMDHYKQNMYFTEIDGQGYAIKPMNCVSHMLIYKAQVRSYRDLPLRFFELGTVTRHEKSGVLHGLLRVRQFTQDDAHIFCRPDQLLDEIAAVLDLVADVMKIFGFDYELEISTRPEDSIGTDEDWEMATDALKQTLDNMGLPYEINEGDGAFYGPKIDVKIKDAIGREWQCATVQCDFSLPDRFDINYVGSDGERHRPVMLHRVVFGSVDRFMGVLIEHYAGAFPVWLAPVQAVVMNITDAQGDYARKVTAELKAAGVRCEQDLRNEKIGFKIREARLQKIPYMLVIGDREMEEGTVTVRDRSGEQRVMTVAAFVEEVRKAEPKI